MFYLTKIGTQEEKIYLNPELIKTVHVSGDTIITLVTGEVLRVSESPEQIQEAFLRYKRDTSPLSSNQPLEPQGVAT